MTDCQKNILMFGHQNISLQLYFVARSVKICYFSFTIQRFQDWPEACIKIIIIQK